MDFQVWEFPGHLNYFDPAFDTDDFLADMGALIWVIDAQDDYFEAISRLNQTILEIQPMYPNINIEVFVHKVDSLSDEYRLDTYRDIVHRVQDELQDAGYENAHVYFHLTSIYDHTIFEAFSKVIQRLIPTELAALEALLTSLVARCRIEKAYLFDVLSKIYIAQDVGSKDSGSYEICSDYIDVVVDISEIYGWDRGELEDAEPEDVDGEENGNQDAESLVIMGRKNDCYLYLKEINK
jgi:Ras-related GTP-binding protein C/D